MFGLLEREQGDPAAKGAGSTLSLCPVDGGSLKMRFSVLYFLKQMRETLTSLHNFFTWFPMTSSNLGQ